MSSLDREQRSHPALSALPAIHRLLSMPEMREAAETIPSVVLTEAARSVLAVERTRILQCRGEPSIPDKTAICMSALRQARRRMERSLIGAVNATGIVLHTGLGRARLAIDAVDAMIDVARGHSTLEVDRETGRRGSRRDHVSGLLRELTGAEDAVVVNNCAAAVLLAVTVLAAGREVIISRGELVEIGGAFRMPDIVRASGATLVEVGTTNRTRVGDYADAITDRTGLILRCHPSNFAIVGFTEEATTEQLVGLGREHAIPVMDDQGSGALLPPRSLGLPEGKGSLRESIAAGCDVVTASGDKLLGGPQAGIIAGRRDLIQTITAHPLSRALRVDKLTLAALEATLLLYRDPDRALRQIPTLRYLVRGLPELTRMAETLAARIAEEVGSGFGVEVVSERSQVGGGSVPGEELPTACVSLRHDGSAITADEIAAAFRRHRPPVFGRIKSDAMLLDPRTLEPEEFDAIVDAARGLASTPAA